MTVLFNDLSRQNKPFLKDFKKKLNSIILNSDFVLGKDVKKFEEEFANFLGAKYCVGVASGTDGLLLSLLSLGIGENDEVVVPAFTFSATVSPIILIGAKPVLVDIERNSPNINPQEIEKVITKKTKAIIAVHMYGMACDLDSIRRIASKHRLNLIEDACQAHGTIYQGKQAGTIGDIGYFSFYPGKNLGALGDGGAIITRDKNIYQNLLMLRNHGQITKYNHLKVGINSRLDSIQAAFLSLKLKKLKNWNQQRAKVASYYLKNLNTLPLVLFSDLGDNQNNHLFVIRVKDRAALKKHLEKSNIESGIHYPKPIHLLPAFKSLGYKKGEFTNAEILASTCLSLPMFPGLKTKEMEYVVKSIRSFFKY